MLPLRRLEEFLRSRGGVATRADLVALGASPYALTRAVRSGALLRLRRSRYALPDVDSALRAAISHGGILGGLSAARTYGWWTGTDTRIHISWPAHGNVAKPARVVFGTRPDIVHHWRILRGDPPDSLTRETPLESLAQVVISGDRDTAVACADSAMRLGSLSESSVRGLLRRMPARVSGWERYLDSRSDSGIESIVRIWLIERGIPFTFHPTISGVGEVDFLLGDSLIVETDGSAFHDSTVDRDRDARRETFAAARGYLTMRIRYRMVIFEPEMWQRRLLEHLSRGDHRRRIA